MQFERMGDLVIFLIGACFFIAGSWMTFGIGPAVISFGFAGMWLSVIESP